jgi:hypothetical protein
MFSVRISSELLEIVCEGFAPVLSMIIEKENSHPDQLEKVKAMSLGLLTGIVPASPKPRRGFYELPSRITAFAHILWSGATY